MFRDISEATKVVSVPVAASREGSVEERAAAGTIDTLGFCSVMFAIMGTNAGTATMSIQHGDDENALTAAPAESLVLQPAISGGQTRNLGYIGGRRFVRLLASGVTGGTAVCVLQNPDAIPVG